MVDLLPGEYVKWYVILGPVRHLFFPPETLVVVDEATALVLPPAEGYIWDHLRYDLRRIVTLTGGGGAETRLSEALRLPWLVLLPTLFTMGLLALGTVRWAASARTGKRAPAAFWFVGVCYALVVLGWRGGGERLWYPIQPQLFLAFGLGLFAVCEGGVRLWRRITGQTGAARVAGATVALVLGAWLIFAVYRDVTLRTGYEMAGDFRRRAEPVSALIPPGAVVSSDWPAYDYLHSGREMTQVPEAETAEGLLAALQAERVDYVVVAVDEWFQSIGRARRAGRTLESAPLLKELVARGALVRLYSNDYPLQILRVAPGTLHPE
jgi:hypothetical protein